MLLTLPDELILTIARNALRNDLPSGLRIRQVSKILQRKCQPLKAEAESRRLRWMAELTDNHEISNEARTLTRVPGAPVCPWAAGGLLPTSGRSSFTVRVEQSAGNQGMCYIGVCDKPGRCCWGFYPHSGTLLRATRNAQGESILDAPPPMGYPDGHQTRVMFDEHGFPTSLYGRVVGSVIEVHVDHDEGTLGFRVNAGPLLLALRGFPKGAPLRPWVCCMKQSQIYSKTPCLLQWLRCVLDDGDRVSLVRPYL